MLTAEENALLTQTGPETPMGAVFRSYWMPILLARELEPDGAPQRLLNKMLNNATREASCA